MEKPELMKQIEEKKNEGWEVVHISSGPVARRNLRSALYYALQDATKQHPDHDINYLVSPNTRRGEGGFDFVIMSKPRAKKEMNRITKYSGGAPVIPHNRIQDAVRMLAAYEDTGLTPEEIAEGFNVSTTEKHRRNENV